MNTKPYSHAVVLYTTNSMDAFFASALVRRILHQKYLLPDSCIDARAYSFIEAGKLNNTYVPEDSVLFLIGVRVTTRDSDRALALVKRVRFENTFWFDNSNDSVFNANRILAKVPGTRDCKSLASLVFEYFENDEDVKWDETPNVKNMLSLHESYTRWDCTSNKALALKNRVMTRNYDSVFGYDRDNIWDRLITDEELMKSILEDGYVINKYVNIQELETRKRLLKHARVGLLGTDGVKTLDAAIMNHDSGGARVFDGAYNKCNICILYYHNGNKYIYELFSKDTNAGCDVIAKSLGGHCGNGSVGVSQYGTFVREDNIMARVRPLFRIDGPVKDLWPDVPLKEIDGDLPDSEISKELGRRDANEKRLATVGANSDDEE